MRPWSESSERLCSHSTENSRLNSLYSVPHIPEATPDYRPYILLVVEASSKVQPAETHAEAPNGLKEAWNFLILHLMPRLRAYPRGTTRILLQDRLQF